jgi:hypothetical protein
MYAQFLKVTSLALSTLATYKMALMYFLVNIYINNQSTLYKVNGVAPSS